MEKSKWTPTPAQRSILDELNRESNRDGNVTQFCKDFAPFTHSKFSKIMDAIDPDRPKSYFDDIKKPDDLMEELEEWLDKLPKIRLEKERTKDLPLYKLSTFRAVAVSIRQCKNKSTPERITKYISPTGGSKTSLCRFLMEEFKSELAPAHVECRESWRPASRDTRARAKRTALTDICGALKVRVAGGIEHASLDEIEDRLMTFCTDTARLLFFDEGEFFSDYVLNLVKMLLNQTRLVVVIACTPRAHRKWNNYYADEADQIARRTHSIVQVSTVPVADAALFFDDGKFVASEREQALGMISKEASHFGHYSLIARVANILDRTTGKADMEEVSAALLKAQTQMGRDNWDGNRNGEGSK